MSRAGTHWKLKHEKKDAPCFTCGTEPRLEGHVVCSGCHDELRCQRESCNPGSAFRVPAFYSRGFMRDESETGHAV